ncbi:O-methyltransferase [Clostridia bacterium]|nr:O-methyltransferase [Clostridia bacterium]
MSELTEYITNILPQTGGKLGEIERAARAEGLPIIPADAAAFLKTLLSVAVPSRILEIGCCIGFSAMLMAETLPEAHITTIDRYEIMIDAARENFRKTGLADRITLIAGDALKVLEILTQSPIAPRYDFIFMDAAKGQYINMLPFCMELLRTGGVLLADDCFQGGSVAGERLRVKRRNRTTHTRMNEFLAKVCGTKGLRTSLIPLGDGLALVHKTNEYGGLSL